ncbi:hypothetical protein V6N11_023964 [Hibiscus sabdariffa]|uniref:FAR1 domain-containing protein n=1 Tax=Hibiscus sabdariffa TaxID=183260 RepID=A0ABR2TPQ0_9ROSI
MKIVESQPLDLHLCLPKHQIEFSGLVSRLYSLRTCPALDSNLDLQPMDENPFVEEAETETTQNSNGEELVTTGGASDEEPYVGMEFESEEAAKVFYDAYATRVGFIMRVDAFRRSMRDGKVVWRRLVCNKEGFRKLRPRRSENRKPRAITREGCKAMIVVKKEKTGKWVVTKFVKDHNHPLVPIPINGRRTILLSQTPDEKDVKIRELTAELQRERKRSAAIQEQLDMVLREMEEHSNHLSRNIDDIVQSVREIETKQLALP